jgi:hypothetical protein
MSEPFAMTKVGLSMKIPTVTALRPDLCFLVLNYREIFVQYDTNIRFAQRTLIPIQARGGDRFVREAFRKLIIPLPGRPNHLSLEALTQDDVSLSADSPWIRGSSDSIQSIIMVDHSRVRNLIIGPELKPDITFAFMPIFPFGNGGWILNSEHPHSLKVDTGMLVSQPEISSHPDAVILVFRSLEYPPEYLGIFLAAYARVRVKLCCRILENVRSDESIKDRFEGELSRYLKNTICQLVYRVPVFCSVF